MSTPTTEVENTHVKHGHSLARAFKADTSLETNPVLGLHDAMAQIAATHKMLTSFVNPTGSQALPQELRESLGQIVKDLGVETERESCRVMRRWGNKLHRMAKEATAAEDYELAAAMVEAKVEMRGLSADAMGWSAVAPFVKEKEELQTAQTAFTQQQAELVESIETEMRTRAEQMKDVTDTTINEPLIAAQAEAAERLEAARALTSSSPENIQAINERIAGIKQARVEARAADTLGAGSLATAGTNIQAALDAILKFDSTDGTLANANSALSLGVERLNGALEKAVQGAQTLINEAAIGAIQSNDSQLGSDISAIGAKLQKAYGAVQEKTAERRGIEQDLRDIELILTPGKSPKKAPELIDTAIDMLGRAFGQGNDTDRNLAASEAGLLYVMRSYDADGMQEKIHDAVIDAALKGPLSAKQGEVFLQLLSLDDTGLDGGEFKTVVEASGANPTVITQICAWDKMKDKEVRDAVKALKNTGDDCMIAVAEGALAKAKNVSFASPTYVNPEKPTDEEALARISQIMNPGFKPVLKDAHKANPNIVSELKADILRVFTPGEHSEAQYVLADAAVSALMKKYDHKAMQKAFKEINDEILERGLADPSVINDRARGIMMTALVMCDTKVKGEQKAQYVQLAGKINYSYLYKHVLAWDKEPAATPSVEKFLTARANSKSLKHRFETAAAKAFLNAD